jgi:hypothetical protein
MILGRYNNKKTVVSLIDPPETISIDQRDGAAWPACLL